MWQFSVRKASPNQTISVQPLSLFTFLDYFKKLEAGDDANALNDFIVELAEMHTVAGPEVRTG